MTETNTLRLPLIAAGQAQKHVTHNEALVILDAMTQLSLESRAVLSPPLSPLEGVVYIIPATATGAWATKTNQFALFRSGAWLYLTPKKGAQGYLKDEGISLLYDGTAWIVPTVAASPHTHDMIDIADLQAALDDKAALLHGHDINDITGLQTALDAPHTHVIADTTGLQTALDGKALTLHTHAIGDVTDLQTALDGKSATTHTHAPPTELHNLTKLGVGTTADAYNQLSVKVNNALFTSKNTGDGGSGDMRLVFNKEAVGNVLSIMLQDNWSGRAEFGLVGSDNLSFRVSSDGSTWNDAFSVDNATGAVNFTRGTQKSQLDVYTVNGTWTKPLWAKRILAVAIGAGSGGGSGRRDAAATARFGGGGGGSGGFSKAEWLSAEIGSSLSFTIGVGGIGGAAQTVDTSDGLSGTAGGDTTILDGSAVLLVGFGAIGATGTGDAANQGKLVSGGGCAGGIGSVRANAGGNASVTANGGSGGISAFSEGAGGGGAGGSISAANVLTNAGEGGAGYFIGGATRKAIGGQAGSAGNGGWDASDKAWSRGAGGGGGGGGAGNAAATSSGASGGKGGNPGGGGGGGGASTNGTDSGAGGNGGRGEVWIISLG